MILSQIEARAQLKKSSINVEEEVSHLIGELAPLVGGVDQATATVLSGLDALSGKFDEEQIISQLRKNVLGKAQQDAQEQAELNSAIEKVAATNGGDMVKAAETV